jgi:dihydrofolate synthase/folylpolyglutamate synthase
VREDPLDYLFSLERLGIKLGLETMTTLCAALENPQDAFRSIIVAGTNGKGSVTSMVDRALRAAGHRSARYTSPHLSHVEERFVMEGREVTTDALRRAAMQVRHTVERLQHQRRLDVPPTFFEFATALAFVLFREATVQVAVLEVGLGGRLDATNIVSPVAAAITSIDFDHQAQLGDTIASIAREKAGVVKPGIPVVCGPLPPDAERVIRDVCAAVGAEPIVVSGEMPGEFADVEPALRGAHQRVNAAVAIALLRELDAIGLPVDAQAIRIGLTDVDWPGRLEEFRSDGACVLLDAAHNPAGAAALCAYLRDRGWTDCALVFGAMQDKDAEAMLTALLPVCGAVVCVTAPTPRASTADDLAAIARRIAPRVTVASVAEPTVALERARALRTRVVAAGSIFLIGPLRDILQKS